MDGEDSRNTQSLQEETVVMKLCRSVAVMLMMTCSYVMGAEYRIQATYQPPIGEPFHQTWTVIDNQDEISLMQYGSLRAQMFLKNDQVIRLVIYKRHEGRMVPFTVTGLRQIQRELTGGYFPFDAALVFRKKASNDVIEIAGNSFKRTVSVPLEDR